MQKIQRDVTWIRFGGVCLQVWQPALILPKNTTHLGLKSKLSDVWRLQILPWHPLSSWSRLKNSWITNTCVTKMFNLATKMQRSCYGSWLTLLASDFYSQLWFSSGKKCWVSMRVAGDLLISLQPASVSMNDYKIHLNNFPQETWFFHVFWRTTSSAISIRRTVMVCLLHLGSGLPEMSRDKAFLSSHRDVDRQAGFKWEAHT